MDIFKAVMNGDLKAVQEAINAVADVNTKSKGGDTPLHTAAVMGHCEIVKELLNAGSDVNIKNSEGYTPVDLAFFRSLDTKNEEERKNICGVLDIFNIRRYM